jgi:universal stress protein A
VEEREEKPFIIVVGLDFSEHGYEALRVAESLARPTPETELHLLHVVHPPVGVIGVLGSGVVPESVPQLMSVFDRAKGELETFCNDLNGRLPGRVRGHVRTGEAAHEICALARELTADLIVVGTHGRSGLGRVLLGSIATSVTKHAPCSVLMVRHPQASTFTSETARGLRAVI